MRRRPGRRGEHEPCPGREPRPGDVVGAAQARDGGEAGRRIGAGAAAHRAVVVTGGTDGGQGCSQEPSRFLRGHNPWSHTPYRPYLSCTTSSTDSRTAPVGSSTCLESTGTASIADVCPHPA